MRQGQQNRRGRGRNRSKGHNPLTRSFESNGPDVKIRGTPAHIAEKYISLARDALASGDPVLAENYLQHAEHYNRIIMAYREQQMQQAGEMMNGGMPRPRAAGLEPMETGEDFGEDEIDDLVPDLPQPRGQEPQPRVFEGAPRPEDRPPRPDDRPPRPDDRPPRPEDRSPRPEQGRQRERAAEPRDRGSAPERPPAEGAGDGGGQPRPQGQPRRRERFAQQSQEQPEFLRRPVRRPRREPEDGEAGGGAAGGEEGSPEKTTA
jgi:hypothetical protein